MTELQQFKRDHPQVYEAIASGVREAMREDELRRRGLLPHEPRKDDRHPQQPSQPISIAQTQPALTKEDKEATLQAALRRGLRNK